MSINAMQSMSELCASVSLACQKYIDFHKFTTDTSQKKAQKNSSTEMMRCKVFRPKKQKKENHTHNQIQQQTKIGNNNSKKKITTRERMKPTNECAMCPEAQTLVKNYLQLMQRRRKKQQTFPLLSQSKKKLYIAFTWRALNRHTSTLYHNEIGLRMFWLFFYSNSVAVVFAYFLCLLFNSHWTQPSISTIFSALNCSSNFIALKPFYCDI